MVQSSQMIRPQFPEGNYFTSLASLGSLSLFVLTRAHFIYFDSPLIKSQSIEFKTSVW